MAAGSESLCSTLLFVGLFVFVSADQKNISAESGQNVILTCRAPNNKNDHVRVVEWSRADLKTKYVFLYRDGHFDQSNQHPSFKNRVELQDRQMKDGDVSLILKNVTTDDDGTYECRIKTGTRRRKRAILATEPISIINLRVVDPPGPTEGTTEDGGSVGLIVGLSVAAVLLVAAVGFVIYRKHKEQQSHCSYRPPAEPHSV